MAKVKLAKSKVKFDESTHTYTLGKVQLSGITNLITEVVGLGYHGEAPRSTLERAAEYGTSVHKAIEAYDTTGERIEAFSRSEQFCTGTDTVWNVSQELDHYIAHKEGYATIANEYTVSDNKRYASQIDIIWQDTEGNLVLVDTKTNNLKYYPGGKEKWLKYLSWQLSIYAYLFEHQNPKLKVSSLLCNWLRQDEHELIEIVRLPNDDVARLLSVNYDIIDGEIVFDEVAASSVFVDDMSNPQQLTPVKVVDTTAIVGHELVDKVYDTYATVAKLDRLKEELTETIRQAMIAHGITKWDSGKFVVTLTPDTVVTTLDTTKLKKDHPELFSQYIKESPRKGSIRIKLN